ncbi:unnamed protein product [Adineta ricciae]|uniref:G-protein coupled receptors family 1 profile domain-containing protein n=1 Tax=Adineta ricciae TaxID=249248 RepID=A0A815CU99_ADIRI|nr:unnamed protein product [Adineta ricciae]
MADLATILSILQLVLMGLALVLTLIYSLSILSNRRFHHQNNIFILNICFAIMTSAIFFLAYLSILNFNVKLFYISNICIIIYYAYSIASIQIPFAFVAFTVHRFCFILYHTRPFFRTNKWVIICIGGQWIIQFLISLPFIIRSQPYCLIPVPLRLYFFMIVVIVPLFMNIILNVRIFIHVRSSSCRVRPAWTASTIINVNNTQQQQQRKASISRREISLLRQMIFMFTMFIGGWTPIYFMLYLSQIIYISGIIQLFATILCEFALLSLIINLFICNRELREYLMNKLRFCLMREYI